MKKVLIAMLALSLMLSALLFSSCSLDFIDDISSAISGLSENEPTTQNAEGTTAASTEAPAENTIPYSKVPEIPEFVLPSEDYKDDIEREAAEIIDGAIEKAISYVSVMKDDRHSFISYRYDDDSDGYLSKLDENERDLFFSLTDAAQDFVPYKINADEYAGNLKDAYFDLFSARTYVSADVASYADIVPTTYVSFNDYETHYSSVSLFYFDPYKDANSRIGDEEGMKKLEHDISLFERIIERIVDKMPEGLSTYDKYYYLAAVLSEHVMYDDRPKNCYTAFGALVCGRAVCEGYSTAYYLLCREADLWCAYRAGGGHIWNMVMLDSGVYNVDVTWCDSHDAYRYKWYNYFMKSDEDFSDHTPNVGMSSTGTFEPCPYEE